MSTLAVVRVVAVVCTGLIAGIFLGHRMGVSRAMPELSPSSFVQLQQIIHATFVRMMPVLLLGATIASVAWTIGLRGRRRSAEFWLVASATAALVGVVVMTRAVNVPINNQLMTWSVGAPPTDLNEVWRPWERIHSIRTVLAAGAFVFQVVALSAFGAHADRR